MKFRVVAKSGDGEEIKRVVDAPSRFAVYEQMEKEGLEVAVDSIGNVTGRRRGTGGGPTVVFAAHLDTVHPLDTDVRVRVQGDTLRAPGVFDNSASLANMLAAVRALATEAMQ